MAGQRGGAVKGSWYARKPGRPWAAPRRLGPAKGERQLSKKDRSIAVTGGSGFVAGHLIPRLLDGGVSVRLLLRHPEGASELIARGVEVVEGDVRDQASLAELAKGAAVIIHLVGISRESAGQSFEETMVGATRGVVEAARGEGAKVVFMSALNANAASASRYLRAKWESEEIIRGSGLDHTICRSSYLYGSRSPFLNLVVNQVRLPVTPVMGAGKARLSPFYVEDLAEMLKKAAMPGGASGTFETCGPDVVTFNELLDLVARLSGGRARKLHLPLAIARPGVRVSELPPFTWLSAPIVRRLFRDYIGVGSKVIAVPPITRGEMELLQMDFVCDLQEVRRAFEIRPTRLWDGLEAVLAPLRKGALESTEGETSEGEHATGT